MNNVVQLIGSADRSLLVALLKLRKTKSKLTSKYVYWPVEPYGLKSTI